MIWAGLAYAFPFPVHQETLDNGMQVVWIPMDTPGVVATQLHLDVGSRDEVDEGYSGFAHFFEHLMFSDTEARTRNEREQALLLLGVSDGAYTTHDRTVYYAVSPTSSLSEWLSIQADSFAGATLTDDAVRREAGAVQGEWRRGQADPGFALWTGFVAAAFGDHPYGHTVIGFDEDVAAMPEAFEYAKVFAARHMRPEKARLFIAGDVKDGTAAKVFETWKVELVVEEETEGARTEVVSDEAEAKETRVVVPWEARTSARVTMGWSVPPARADLTSETLRAMEPLLFGPRGRLTQRLVREEAIATRVSGGHDERSEAGQFMVSATASAPEHLPRIEAVIAEELTRLKEEPSAEDLKLARARQATSVKTSMDTPTAVIREVARRLRNGGLEDLETIEVTVEDVKRVASETFVDAERTTAVLGAE